MKSTASTPAPPKCMKLKNDLPKTTRRELNALINQRLPTSLIFNPTQAGALERERPAFHRPA